MSDQVGAILTLTQDMMVEVIEGRWDGLIDMQLQQDQLIRALFAIAGKVLLDSEKEDLVEVERLSREIYNAAEIYQADIASKLREMRLGKTKAGVYQSL